MTFRSGLFTGFFMLAAAFAAFSQTFHPVSGNILTKQVAFNEANECYIFFDNPSGDTLRLFWRRLEVSLPAGWDVDLCDYGACYIGIPSSNAMNPVYDTIQPYLKLVVQPSDIAGAGWIWFKVYELDNEANSVDVYFDLHTLGTTSAVQLPDTPALRVFPNPASGFFQVKNEYQQPARLRLSDLAGRVVWENTLQAGEQAVSPVLPPGMYILHDGHFSKKITIQ